MTTFDPSSGMRRLLAQRLGVSEEEVARMSAGEASPPGTAADPIAATLVSWLAQRNAGQEPNRPGNERALEQAGLAVKALQQELQAANARTERIAEALGACQDCWGNTPACPRCGGRGRAGFAYPMKEQLLALVTPALTKLGLTVVDVGHAADLADPGTHPR